MPKLDWRDKTDRLDPDTEYDEIQRVLSLYEFPWDMNQSLSFALFRTYAVPSIGRLLYETGEFTERVQKRYDDTALLLEAPLVHGFDSPEGKAGVRRINQMHKMYDISNDDMRYVLATFVVVPKRWLDDYGWRRLTRNELRGTVNYYRALGQHMNIKDLPETYEGFAELMNAYEAEHFAYDEGARRVADSTLSLLVDFYPGVAGPLVEKFSKALMDPPLLAAFRYDPVSPSVRRLSENALKRRARLLARTPRRTKPYYIMDSPRTRTYTGSPDVSTIGTFTPGCPVPHATGTASGTAPATVSG